MVGPAMTTLYANKVLTGPLFWSNVLIWPGLVWSFFFSISSRLFNAVFFIMFTRISIVDAQIDLGLLSV